MFHITSDKSYNITFPNIPKQYIYHFIRGYLDGDGHINYKGYTEYCRWIHSIYGIIASNCYLSTDLILIWPGKHIRVFITGRKSIKQFADWIYTDKSLYLKRKFAAFDQEKLSVDELQDRKRNRS